MQALLDWFASVSDFIVTLIEFTIGMIEDVITMVWLLGVAALEIPQIITFIPGPLVAILCVFLTAAILYKFLGREG